jgi:uncharacterized protein YukE
MSEKAVKKDHQVRGNQCFDLSVDPDGRNVAQVKQLVQMLDPKRIEKAGNAYVDAGAAMALLEDDLMEMARQMATCWEGKASVEAQKAIQVIHASVRELQRRLFHMGRPLENLGQNVLPRHKQFIDNDGFTSWSNNSFTGDDSMPGTYDVMDGGAEWGSQDELAGKHLAILNKDFAETFHLLPESIHNELPELKDPEIPTFTGVGGPGGPGGVPGGLPGGVPGGFPGGGAGISARGVDPGDFDSGLPPVGVPPGATPPGNLPSGVPNGAAAIPGTPAPGQPGVPDPSSVPPAPPAPTAPAVGTVPDPGRSTTLADAAPRFDVPTAPTAPAVPGPATPPTVPSAQYPLRISPYENGTPYGHPGMPSGVSTGVGTGGGSGTSNNAPLRGAPGGSAVGGAPFMPMGGMGGGGGGGGEQQDREASTWLKEDDDVWGLQSDGTVSDTIG